MSNAVKLPSIVVVTVLLAVVSVPGCGTGDTDLVAPSQADDRLRHADGGPNLLFVVLDAARARNFGIYGYHRDTTPHIDRLAEEGVYFTNAFAQSTSTPDSIESYFSGMYFPLWRKKAAEARYTGAENVLPRAFLNAGYRTGAFSDNPYITEDFGYVAGFEHWEEYTDRWTASYKRIEASQYETQRMLVRIMEWIGAMGEQPWFAYVHLLRPHGPYIAPDPYQDKFTGTYDGSVDGFVSTIQSLKNTATPEQAQHLQDLYDGNLAYADAFVNAIVDWLKGHGLYDDTWIVITSDHGEEFMEHGALLHGGRMYEELIHVPLVIKPAKDFPVRAARNGDLVALVDLLPTFVEVFGLTPPKTMEGVSLVGLLQGENDWGREHVYAYRPIVRDVAVRSASKKFMAFFRATYSFDHMKPIGEFDLINDPMEQSTRAVTSDEAMQYYELIAGRIGALDAAPVVDEIEIGPEREEQLKAVGYLN